jgi:hypothetical protein
VRTLALGIGVVVVAFACVSVAGASGGSGGLVKYEISYTGLLFVKHSDTGTMANGGDCSTDPQLPFSDRYTLKLAWDADFKFGFRPSGTAKGLVAARTTRVHGSSFSYSGFFYNQSCQKVSYGPGGKPCTGTVVNHGKAYMVAKGTAGHGELNIKLEFQPFGSLTGNPASCNDDDSPPVAYTAEDEMGLSGLSQQLQNRVLSSRERLAGGVEKTIPYKIDIKHDCSAPGSDQGDTDTCSTTYTGNAYLKVEPLGGGSSK